MMLVLLFVSCQTYPNNSKGYWVMRDNYKLNDTLFVGDYVVNHIHIDDHTLYWKKKGVQIDGDSIFEKFKVALNNTGLNINYLPNASNKSNKHFSENLKLRARKMDEQELLKLIPDSATNQLVLIPLIQIITIDEQFVMFYGGPYSVKSFLYISFYIFKDNEIHFFKSMYRYNLTDKYRNMPTELLLRRAALSQDHFNNLVRDVFRSYAHK